MVFAKAAASSESTASVAIFALLLYSVLMWLGKRLLAEESVQAIHNTLMLEGGLMLVVIFIGLCVMMYIQRLQQKKHEALQRKLTRAAEEEAEETEE